MSVLVGLRCGEGAVLACDSKEVRANYYRFWPKFSIVGGCFVVLYVGNPTLGETFARRLDGSISRARQNGRLDRSKVARLVEGTLQSLAKEGGEESVKGRQMLIAGIADTNEVCLWAVDAGEIYPREMRVWECYGSGADVAEILMKDLYCPDITTEQAASLLAYVIDAVSEVCLDCGGPTNMIIVDKEGVKPLGIEEVRESLERVRSRLDHLRKELPRRVLKGEEVDIS
jgi:20S proteasome alpha/beta subunit